MRPSESTLRPPSPIEPPALAMPAPTPGASSAASTALGAARAPRREPNECTSPVLPQEARGHSPPTPATFLWGAGRAPHPTKEDRRLRPTSHRCPAEGGSSPEYRAHLSPAVAELDLQFGFSRAGGGPSPRLVPRPFVHCLCPATVSRETTSASLLPTDQGSLFGRLFRRTKAAAAGYLADLPSLSRKGVQTSPP